MKHFMTWWENEPTDFHLWTQYRLMKFAWRAALKWALRHQWETDDGAKAISAARLERELK